MPPATLSAACVAVSGVLRERRRVPGKFVTMVYRLLGLMPDTPDARRLREDTGGEMVAALDVDEPGKVAEALIATIGKHGDAVVLVRPVPGASSVPRRACWTHGSIPGMPVHRCAVV